MNPRSLPVILARLAPLAAALLFAGCATVPPSSSASANGDVVVGTAEPGPAAPTASATPPARPFLWRIEGERPSWLFGTIHLPDQRVTSLSPAVSAALGAADVVVTEIPLTPEARQEVAAAAMLPPGQTLEQLLPPPLLERTIAYLASRKLPFAPFSRMKVWALSAQLVLLDYLPQMMMNPPLDMQLHDRAHKAGARTDGLETVGEQLSIFESLTLEQQIELHGTSLDQLEQAAAEGTSPARELVEAYLTGDGELLLAKVDESVAPGDVLAEEMLDRMMTQRNYRMADRIAERIAAEPGTSWFFAVGAGHLPGDEGIVELLRGRGVSVARVQAEP